MVRGHPAGGTIRIIKKGTPYACRARPLQSSSSYRDPTVYHSNNFAARSRKESAIRRKYNREFLGFKARQTSHPSDLIWDFTKPDGYPTGIGTPTLANLNAARRARGLPPTRAWKERNGNLVFIPRNRRGKKGAGPSSASRGPPPPPSGPPPPPIGGPPPPPPPPQPPTAKRKRTTEPSSSSTATGVSFPALPAAFREPPGGRDRNPPRKKRKSPSARPPPRTRRIIQPGDFPPDPVATRLKKDIADARAERELLARDIADARAERGEEAREPVRRKKRRDIGGIKRDVRKVSKAPPRRSGTPRRSRKATERWMPT